MRPRTGQPPNPSQATPPKRPKRIGAWPYLSGTVWRSLRIPEGLERRARKDADKRGCSLGRWIVAAIAVALRHKREMRCQIEKGGER